jgi:WD40 repeat protein
MSMFAYSDPEDCGVEAVSPLVRTTTLQLPVNITECCFNAGNSAVAVSRGDGKISIVTGFADIPPPDEDDGSPLSLDLELATHDTHDVAATRVCAAQDGFVTAGQDGRIFWLPADGISGPQLLWQSDGGWIEALVSHGASGVIAAATGKTVVVMDPTGAVTGLADMPGNISGLAFDGEARRLAVSHYDGVSILSLPGCTIDLKLSWRGWHIGVSWSPCGRYLVTATQEKELHAWDLVTMQDYRVGGYPRKVSQMAWTSDGHTMVCSGADVITAWPFAGAGPNGMPPVEIGFVFGGMVRTVAASPDGKLVAGGFNTGNVLIGATGKGEAVVAQPRTGQEITCLSWSPSSRQLAAGSIDGRFSLFTLASDLRVK